MKTYIIFFFFLISLNGRTETLKGKGYAPLIGDDQFIARTLASFDALLDALLKTSFEISAQTSIENSLLANQTVSVRIPDLSIELTNRKCIKELNSMLCEIEIEVKNRLKEKNQNSKLKPIACPSDVGVYYCYRIINTQQMRNGNYVNTVVEGEELVLWNIKSNEKKIISKPFTLKGIGWNEKESFNSATRQIPHSPEVQARYIGLSALVEIKMPSTLLEQKHHTYLSLLGGYSQCFEGTCALLLPKIVL